MTNHSHFEFLLDRLTRADDKWVAAMKRSGYRDDPDEADTEGCPFTEQDWALYGWADAWRLMVHKIENELDEQPETRLLVTEVASFSAYEPTFAEAEMTIESLSNQTKDLRTGNQVGKAPRTKRSRASR